MIDYAPIVKAARLEATLEYLNGGRIELLLANGVLAARIDLDDPAGLVFAGLLKFSGFPKFGMVQQAGNIAKASLVDRAGALVARGLTVGVKDADVLLDNVTVRPENLVKLLSAEIRHG